MALTAAVATAVAAVCAVAALGGAGAGGLLLPAAVVAVALVPGIVRVAAHPDRRIVPPDKEMRGLIILTGAGGLAFYVAGTTSTVSQLATIGRLAVLVVVPLSFLWPSPAVLRYCLLVSAGSLVVAAPRMDGTVWPVVGVAAGAAVALVALKRQGRDAELPPARQRAPISRGRLGREAATLLAISGLVGLLIAALLPPRNPQGGGPEAGDDPQEAQDPVRYLQPSETLDTAAGGSGRGDEVVLRITAPEAALWRSQTFDRWDGRRWSRTVELPEGVFIPSQQGLAFVPPGIGDVFAPGEAFRQRVRVLAPSAGVLVAAPRAQQVEVARGRVQVGPDGSIAVSPPLGRGATYIVTSTRIRPIEEQLRLSNPSPSGAPTAYLQLPPVPERVGALAAAITNGADTHYDRVLAVEGWLLTNAEVALGSDRLGSQVDPVEDVLFGSRQGSPEQLATTMSVLLRALGIPARVAVGFLPGDRYDLSDDFVVRARHAHAWVEAWFSTAGWVSFDPSARTGTPDQQESFLERLRRLLGAFWWVLVIALAVGVRWLTLRAFRRWQRRRARPWVTRCYARILRAGQQGGRPRRPHETPVEYCTALADAVDDERLVAVGELISAGAWSGREPPRPARAWADGVVKEAERRSHRRRPRRRSVGVEGPPR